MPWRPCLLRGVQGRESGASPCVDVLVSRWWPRLRAWSRPWWPHVVKCCVCAQAQATWWRVREHVSVVVANDRRACMMALLSCSGRGWSPVAAWLHCREGSPTRRPEQAWVNDRGKKMMALGWTCSLGARGWLYAQCWGEVLWLHLGAGQRRATRQCGQGAQRGRGFARWRSQAAQRRVLVLNIDGQGGVVVGSSATYPRGLQLWLEGRHRD